MMTRRFGPKITLCTGSLVVAAGFVIRIALTGHLWEIVVGTTIAGAGTGIAYAAMPALIALGCAALRARRRQRAELAVPR